MDEKCLEPNEFVDFSHERRFHPKSAETSFNEMFANLGPPVKGEYWIGSQRMVLVPDMCWFGSQLVLFWIPTVEKYYARPKHISTRAIGPSGMIPNDLEPKQDIGNQNHTPRRSASELST